MLHWTSWPPGQRMGSIDRHAPAWWFAYACALCVTRLLHFLSVLLYVRILLTWNGMLPFKRPWHRPFQRRSRNLVQCTLPPASGPHQSPRRRAAAGRLLVELLVTNTTTSRKSKVLAPYWHCPRGAISLPTLCGSTSSTITGHSAASSRVGRASSPPTPWLG